MVLRMLLNERGSHGCASAAPSIGDDGYEEWHTH